MFFPLKFQTSKQRPDRAGIFFEIPEKSRIETDLKRFVVIFRKFSTSEDLVLQKIKWEKIIFSLPPSLIFSKLYPLIAKFQKKIYALYPPAGAPIFSPIFFHLVLYQHLSSVPPPILFSCTSLWSFQILAGK